MTIIQAVVNKIPVPQWAVDGLKVPFANDLRFSLASAADPVLSHVPELPTAMLETVAAMNAERQFCIEAMDKSHAELSQILKSKLANVRNLTKGDNRAPSFDFTDEKNLPSLPTSIYSNTLISAFDGKNDFYKRMSDYCASVEKAHSKINHAIKHEPVLTSDSKIRSANDKWTDGVLNYYIGGVALFTTIGFVAYIWEERLSFGSVFFGSGYAILSVIFFGLLFGVIALVIGVFGNVLVKSANDDRSGNKLEVDKLKIASQSITGFRDFSLTLNNGNLNPKKLKDILQSANRW